MTNILNPPQLDFHFLGFLIAGFAILFWALFIVPHLFERRPAKAKRRDAGLILLTEMIVVCSIVLILVSIPLLNLQLISAANQATDAWSTLRAVNKGEGFYFRIFPGEGYQTPQFLSSNGVVAARSCDTPEVLGSNYSSPFVNGTAGGYSYTFTPGAVVSSAAPGCTNPGFQTYSITANPVNPASHYFLFTDQTGTIRYNATQTANAADAILNW